VPLRWFLPANYLVPAATAAAVYALPCIVTDDLSRSSNFNISLTVQAPPPTFHTISEINGPGTSSPLGAFRSPQEALVIALRVLTGSVRGFYLESQTADRDADLNTSEGLLVFNWQHFPAGMRVLGNLVQIEGTVSNFVPSTSPVGSVPLTETKQPGELPGFVDQPIGQTCLRR